MIKPWNALDAMGHSWHLEEQCIECYCRTKLSIIHNVVGFERLWLMVNCLSISVFHTCLQVNSASKSLETVSETARALWNQWDPMNTRF